MKAASVMLIVSSFNSFIVAALGMVMMLGNYIEPNWAIGVGMFILGMVGLVVFYVTMVGNMRSARAIKLEVKK
uniref:Uncharacterized protein n=1 Tax=viral metagenome TaxID=1070528 RepID=A0A6M3L4U5_9ZZZZ